MSCEANDRDDHVVTNKLRDSLVTCAVANLLIEFYNNKKQKTRRSGGEMYETTRDGEMAQDL